MNEIQHIWSRGDRVRSLDVDLAGTVINNWADARVAVVRWDDGTQSSVSEDQIEDETDLDLGEDHWGRNE